MLIKGYPKFEGRKRREKKNLGKRAVNVRSSIHPHATISSSTSFQDLMMEHGVGICIDRLPPFQTPFAGTKSHRSDEGW